MVKVVSLGFYSIKKLFIRDAHAKFDIPNSLKSPDIGKVSDGVIFNFWISGQISFKPKLS